MTKNMQERALDLLRSDPTKSYTLQELRLFANVKVRSRGRLHSDLMHSGEVELIRPDRGDYRYRLVAR